MPAFIDLTGQRFGRLTVLERAPNRSNRVHWLCRCECGNKSEVAAGCLRSGNTKSCGCLDIEALKKRATTHGHTTGRVRTPEYKAWTDMWKRCRSHDKRYFADYLARGIRVCERWKHYSNFFADMAPKPPGLSLGRIDNSKGYSPENCRWETQSQQMRNTRRNRMVLLNGVEMPLIEAIEKSGISKARVYDRMRAGLPREQWLAPVRKWVRRSHGAASDG